MCASLQSLISYDLFSTYDASRTQDLGYCDMVDYKVYASLNVPDAEKKAEEIGEMHIGAWRDYVQHRQPAKPKKKKMGSYVPPPDCFELPIRAYTEAEYLDAAALGAEGEADSGGRADDILKIAALLDEEALTEHAVVMYLQALRYRSDDTAVCQ